MVFLPHVDDPTRRLTHQRIQGKLRTMRTDEATSLWTFEIEGPGYPGGYYTPAEDWVQAEHAARWLALALHDFGAITGDRQTQTKQRAHEFASLIEQVSTTHSWVEGGHTVTVIRMDAAASDPTHMGTMDVRRRIRQRQRDLTSATATGKGADNG